MQNILISKEKQAPAVLDAIILQKCYGSLPMVGELGAIEDGSKDIPCGFYKYDEEGNELSTNYPAAITQAILRKTGICYGYLSSKVE